MLINVSLSNEQATLLLPLIPKLAAQALLSATTSGTVSDKPQYAIAEVFARTKKSTRSTPAQLFLKVRYCAVNHGMLYCCTYYNRGKCKHAYLYKHCLFM